MSQKRDDTQAPVDLDPATLGLEEDGRTLLCPCLEVVIFGDAPIGPAAGDFFDRTLKAFGDIPARYLTDGMKRAASFDEAARKAVLTWLDRPRIGKRYYAQVEGPGPGASAWRLELVLIAKPPAPKDATEADRLKREWAAAYASGRMAFSPPISTLRATFPIEGRWADPSTLRDWVLGLGAVRDAGLVSGLSGLSFNLDSEASPSARDRAGQRLAAALLRHPGLDYHDVGSVQAHMLAWDAARLEFVPKVKRANWLTLIDARAIAALGGAGAIRERLGEASEVTLHEAGPNLIIQAGSAPRLGDVGRRDFLPAYRQVAEVVRPLRLKHHAGLGRTFPGDLPDEWLDGLDRAYD
jgi:hypothetical protein